MSANWRSTGAQNNLEYNIINADSSPANSVCTVPLKVPVTLALCGLGNTMVHIALSSL